MTHAANNVAKATQSLEALKGHLEGQEFASVHAFLFASRGKVSADRWRRMKLSSNLAPGFRERASQSLLADITKRSAACDYALDDIASNHIGIWKRDDLPEVATWFDQRPSITWPHLFDADSEFLKKIRYHLTSLQTQTGKWLHIYRHRSQASLLHRGFMARFDKSAGEFHEISGDIYHFEFSADFFEWDGYIYILNLPFFEALTNVREVTKIKSTQGMAALGAHKDIIIPNASQIAERVAASHALSKRIASAQKQNIVANLDAARMEARIKKLGLPIIVVKNGGKFEFHVDESNKDAIKAFVNLVSDYYLHSPVTDMEYRATVKEPM